MSNSRCQVCNSDVRCSEVDYESPRFGQLTCLCEDCRIGYELNHGDQSTKNSRGGRRDGAGRPKSEPTKMTRVPVGAYPAVFGLMSRYKRLSDHEKEQIAQTVSLVYHQLEETLDLDFIFAVAYTSELKVALNRRVLLARCRDIVEAG